MIAMQSSIPLLWEIWCLPGIFMLVGLDTCYCGCSAGTVVISAGDIGGGDLETSF